MTRRLVPALALVFLATACGNLGRATPSCTAINGSTVIQLQAVPDAEFVPCINELKAGWSYRHLEPERGRSRFWLNSDRVGEEFLTVTLRESCSIGEATRKPSDEPNTELYVDVDEVPPYLEGTVVVAGERAAAYARVVAGQLEGVEVERRALRLTVDDDVERSVVIREDEALRAGRFVLVIGERDVEAQTFGLRLPGGVDELGLSRDEVLDRLDDSVDKVRYKGFWYYLFEDGCVEYEFDADGEGSETVAEDVAAAVGLLRSEVLRQAARDAGYEP